MKARAALAGKGMFWQLEGACLSEWSKLSWTGPVHTAVWLIERPRTLPLNSPENLPWLRDSITCYRSITVDEMPWNGSACVDGRSIAWRTPRGSQPLDNP